MARPRLGRGSGQVGGDYGPYFQSERNSSLPAKYLDRACRRSGAVYEDQGAVRFKLPRKPIVMDDLVCGRVEVDRSKPINPLGDLEPDMTIRRPDGSWIFHFVNVVDDIEMGITHVIRGEDHLSNTPKHIELYQALGATPPRFAHIPLILNRSGGKMSKRDQGASVQSYLDEGYAPEAVANYLCLIGWSPKDNREKLPMSEVVSLFDLGQINRRNAAFDVDKCFWLNGQYIHEMSLERFRALCTPVMERAGLPIGGFSNDYLDHVLASVKEKIKLLKDVPAWTAYFFTDDFPFDADAVAKVLRAEGAAARLTQLAAHLETVAPAEWEPAALEVAFKSLAAAGNVKTAAYVHPARVAVSGRAVGPSLYHMLTILGQAKVLARLRAAAEM